MSFEWLFGLRGEANKVSIRNFPVLMQTPGRLRGALSPRKVKLQNSMSNNSSSFRSTSKVCFELLMDLDDDRRC